MAKLTRRTLMQTSVGAATVGALVGAVATVPHIVSAASSEAATSQLSNAKLPGPMVAYVSDIKKGEVVLLVGERQITVRDSELAVSLLKASQ